jgi:hypothetical protein
MRFLEIQIVEKQNDHNTPQPLPTCLTEYIGQVVRRVRYRKKVRRDIEAELTAHFEDGLRDCRTSEEREAKARQLITEFGDPKLLAVLCRRAKKRGRPLWLKVLLRSLQVIGAFIIYLIICALPLTLGRPTIRVDYVGWLNEQWRPKQQDAINAKRYYDEAAALYVEPVPTLKEQIHTWEFSLDDCNGADLQALGRWLAENGPAFEMFRKGAETEHYWPVYDVNESGRADIPFSWLESNVVPLAMHAMKGYRRVMMAFREQITYEAHEGRIDQALNDCLALRQFGRHLQGVGFLSDQLVGVAVEQFGYGVIFAILQRYDVTSESLRHALDALAADDYEQRPVISLEGEKAFWYDNIQRTFTDDGRGGGHALRWGMPFASGSWSGNLAKTLVFDYPDRRETVEMVDAYFQKAQEALSAPPNQGDFELQWKAANAAAQGNLLLALVAPAYERVGQQVWALKTREAATITTLAILQYKVRKGQYPARLADLVQEGYLQKLPDDPFGKGPLTYERTDDSFLLYSWGENLTDDGGTPSTDSDGKPRLWTNNGDWVFWPAPEATP